MSQTTYDYVGKVAFVTGASSLLVEARGCGQHGWREGGAGRLAWLYREFCAVVDEPLRAGRRSPGGAGRA